MCFILLLSISQYSYAQAGVWTWMSGSDTTNSSGNYGVKGVSDADNEPPSRYQAAHWKDKDGNFWIFGGWNPEDLGTYNDLWKFNPNTNEWIWMHGLPYTNPFTVYGEKGIPSLQNIPPSASFGTLCWYDGDDGLYMYGGFGGGPFTNVWKYSIAMNEWVWLTGSEMLLDPRVSGMKGVPSPENTPGLRAENETCWTYKKKLWFSCGQNLNLTSSSTWHFDLNTLEWTWVHGPLTSDLAGIKGVQGVFDQSNYPSSRFTHSKWQNEGNAFIFSGGGENDLWHFNSDSLAWRFLGEGDGFPFWEDHCDYNEDNIPSSSVEMGTAEVFDECREVLWLFGVGQNTQTIWAYDLSQEIWVLAWGTPGSPLVTNYGIKGVPSIDNVPPKRTGGSMWSDNDGNLWLYGGQTFLNSFSDMWRFEPDYSCLNLADTTECCELTVTFRISNTMDSSGSVEIQVVDGEGIIEFSIDGGTSWSTDNFFDDLPPGDYDIVVKDENGCLFTGTITILNISVGTTNLENVDFSFSPNPVSDILYIEISHLDQNRDSKAQIRVIDMNGRVLIKSFPNIENSAVRTKLSFRNLRQGNYFVQILIDESYLLQKISKI